MGVGLRWETRSTTQTWKLAKTATGHSANVQHVQWGMGARYLITNALDGKTRVWDSTSRANDDAVYVSGHPNDALDLSGMTVLGEGGRTLLTNHNGHPCVWDVQTGTLERSLKTTLKPVEKYAAMLAAPDGSSFAGAAAYGGGMCVVSTSDLERRVVAMADARDRLSAVAWSPDGRHVMAMVSNSTGLVVWDAASGAALPKDDRPRMFGARAAALSDNESAVVSFLSDLKIWNLASGALIREVQLGRWPADTMALHSSGSMLAATGSERRSPRTLRLYDCTTWELSGPEVTLGVQAGTRDNRALRVVPGWHPTAASCSRLVLRRGYHSVGGGAPSEL